MNTVENKAFQDAQYVYHTLKSKVLNITDQNIQKTIQERIETVKEFFLHPHPTVKIGKLTTIAITDEVYRKIQAEMLHPSDWPQQDPAFHTQEKINKFIQFLLSKNTHIDTWLHPSPLLQWQLKFSELIQPEKACHHIVEESCTNEPTDIQKLEALLHEGSQQNYLNQPFDTHIVPFGGNFFHCIPASKLIKLLPTIMKFDFDLCSKDQLGGNTVIMHAIANAENELAMDILTIAKDHTFLNVQCRPKGNSALHLAVGKGYKNISRDKQILKYSNLELVKKMIANNCNVNLQNKAGNTPLHLACVRRDPEMIQALIQAGADPTLPNKQGKTAKDLLECDYENASNIIKTSVVVFLLDRSEHEKNLQICLEKLWY